MIGETFGRLTVLEWVKTDKQYKKFWLCQCQCGKTKVVRGVDLSRGHTASCGCLTREITCARNLRHGHTINGNFSATYRAWQSMMRRCSNPHVENYARYGGRGIQVCERWQDFRNFLADMGEKPKGLTIDRKDNNGHYEPENCRWATHADQCRNKQSNIILTHQGRTMCLTDWAQEINVNVATLAKRNKKGLPVEAVLSPIVQGKCR